MYMLIPFPCCAAAVCAEYKPDLSDVEQVVARCRTVLLILTGGWGWVGFECADFVHICVVYVFVCAKLYC